MVVVYAHNENDAAAACTAAGDARKGVVLYFTASWCGPCRRIKPDLLRLAEEYKDKLDVVVVDVDELISVAELYKVKSMPTFVFCIGNKQVYEFSGADSAKLVRAFEKLVQRIEAQ
jgi:thioredoxin 1